MFEQNCRIRFSEIDRTGHLSMEGLLRLFQDIGYAHAQERKLGVDYTKEHHYTWYLLSWNIHAISMPKLGEHVTMKTWFYKLQGTLARKNVVMYDDFGRCLAAADTMWVYIDVETQKPAMAPAGFRRTFQSGDGRSQENPPDYGSGWRECGRWRSDCSSEAAGDPLSAGPESSCQ